MKLSVELLNLKNKPVKNEDDEAITLFELVISALLNAQVEPALSHKKTIRFVLANKLSRNETKDLSKILKNKDKTEIMDAVKSIHPPLVVGRIAEIIDPNSLKETDED